MRQFEDEIRDYLDSLCRRLERSNQQKSDQVVQALQDLRDGLEAATTDRDIFKVAAGWSSRFVRPILDCIRQNNL
jgi:chorismate mutase